jgi:hypothetical protein
MMSILFIIGLSWPRLLSSLWLAGSLTWLLAGLGVLLIAKRMIRKNSPSTGSDSPPSRPLKTPLRPETPLIGARLNFVWNMKNPREIAAAFRRMEITRIAGKSLAIVLVPITVFWLGHSVGYSRGYAQRDRELMSNTRTEYNLKVLRKDDENKYLMLTSSGRKWEWKICRERIVTLTPGMVIEQAKYEERGNCKSLAVSSGLGFILARNQSGKPIKEEVNHEQARAYSRYPSPSP